MKLPRTDQTKDGPFTTLAYQGQTWLGEIPCIYVHARGSVEAYFGPNMERDTEVYRLTERDDGTWEAWYYSRDPVLRESRDTFLAMGAWGR
jgi:hypothetical protein